VEVDIRTTRDGQLVVHHDAELVVDGRQAVIATHDLAELAEVSPGTGVPIASELFAAARQAHLGVYVDIKSVTKSAARSLVEQIVSEELSELVILASANAEIVAHLAGLAPDVPRAVLYRSVDEDPIALAGLAHADFVHPCWEDEARPDRHLAGQWLARVREHGLGVVCWHEERPEVLSALLALGVDGICTDEPALLAELTSA
jgi:glycerophosphoryl diester phosphodiesterase